MRFLSRMRRYPGPSASPGRSRPTAEGQQRVQAVIESLLAQEALLEEVFLAYDFSVPDPE